MHFSETLKKLRKTHKLTQEKLAEKLMISKATISHYEQGINKPNLDTIIKLAEIFDVSVDYLIGRSSIPLTFSLLQYEFTSDTSLNDFIIMFLSLDEQHRNDMIKQIEYIELHNYICNTI